MIQTGRVRPGLAVVLSACLLFLPGGCQQKKPLPKTYAAKGKVQFKNGKPMTAGAIEFRSVDNPSATTGAQIQPDGTFTLSTQFDRETAPGALPGEYHVTVIPGSAGDQTKEPLVQPVLLPTSYTIKPDDSNDFTITLPGGSP